jgi:uncharacterized protein YnzC (UPF0291/DUF896 family)
MITDELIRRINELARKKTAGGLTPEELVEQQKLYRIYLDSVRSQLSTQLDAAGVKPRDHVCGDGCGCRHEHTPDGGSH